MIKGFLKGDLVLIENEGNASTLRNKGFIVRKFKNCYSIDIVSACYLVLKNRIAVYDGNDLINFETLFSKLDLNQKVIFATFKHLRDLGKKCKIRGNKIYMDHRLVKAFYYGSDIIFTRISEGIMSLVDSDFESLLYSVRIKRFKDATNSTNLGDFLNKLSKNYIIESGGKFGADFRLYRGKEKHSSLLLNISDFEEARSLIAKARVAHSVRKSLIYCFPLNNSYRCLSINWIH